MPSIVYTTNQQWQKCMHGGFYQVRFSLKRLSNILDPYPTMMNHGNNKFGTNNSKRFLKEFWCFPRSGVRILFKTTLRPRFLFRNLVLFTHHDKVSRQLFESLPISQNHVAAQDFAWLCAFLKTFDQTWKGSAFLASRTRRKHCVYPRICHVREHSTFCQVS